MACQNHVLFEEGDDSAVHCRLLGIHAMAKIQEHTVQASCVHFIIALLVATCFRGWKTKST
jgi:hypothetical protein